MSAVRASKPDLLAQVRARGAAHVAVEASAGTGKTYTIEHLFIDLLLEADATVGVENILIVTFTEKATSELRTRLRGKISSLLHQEIDDGADGHCWTLDTETRTRLERALFNFDAAPIHTIHAFCQRVLRENAFLNGQLFDQERVDQHILFARTFHGMLRDTFTQDHVTARLLTEYLGEKSVSDLEGLLLDVMRTGGKVCPAYVRDTAGAAVEELAAAFDLEAVRADCKSTKKTLRNCEAFAEALSCYRQDGDLESLASKIEALESPLTTPKKASAETTRFLDLLGNWTLAVPSLPSRLVQRILPQLEERLAQEKRRSGLYDYQDMLAGVAAGLDGAMGPLLAETLRRQYRYAIVDEFQDTDPLQWSIFERIFVHGKDSRLFVVGDPKQAIYGFRGGDVHTYRDALGRILHGDEPLRLTHNYRSTSRIIDAYNLVFEDGREVGGAEPDEARLFTGENRYPLPVQCGKPDLRVVDAAGNEVPPVALLHYAPTDTDRVSMRGLRYAYGLRMALEIRGLLDESALHLIKDKQHPGPENRLRAGEIYILTETKKQAAEMACYLREAGMPYAFYKQEGLFQTAEAQDVRDLLAGIADPDHLTCRLKAWATPFFAVAWKDLPACADLPATDALYRRLLEWKELGEQEAYGTLFTRVLDESGIVRRELFFKDSERDLTNYRHILELLLEEAVRNRSSLREIVRTLDNYIADAATPAGEDAGLQRIESERDAVQIMTIHKSKGLEAGIVFVYAIAAGSSRRGVHLFHDAAGERCLYVGSASSSPYAEQIRRETEEEAQRLLYVALTRAKGRLYLPFVGAEGATNLKNGYSALNKRLGHLRSADALTPDFEWRTFDDAALAPPRQAEPADLRSWVPREQVLARTDDLPDFMTLARQHAAFTSSSYTRMKRRAKGPIFEDSEKGEDDAPLVVPPHELPPGIRTGLFVHSILEKIDIVSFARCADLAAWSTDREVVFLLDKTMREYRIDEGLRPHCLSIVHRAMTTPLFLDDVTVPSLAKASKMKRELEFVYPIPETFHPALHEDPQEDRLRIERGYLKGFIDVLFEHEGRVYLADWKSDVLAGYGDEEMGKRVRSHYEVQLRVYAYALLKMLRVHDEASYERFGGVLYLFLRGVGEGKDGVFYRRPSWGEVREYEQWLRGYGGYT